MSRTIHASALTDSRQRSSLPNIFHDSKLNNLIDDSKDSLIKVGHRLIKHIPGASKRHLSPAPPDPAFVDQTLSNSMPMSILARVCHKPSINAVSDILTPQASPPIAAIAVENDNVTASGQSISSRHSLT